MLERIHEENMKKPYAAMLLTLLTIGGCSATTLRCGTSGDDSYVELVNVPQDITGQSRTFNELCGFAFQESENSDGE